SLHKEDADVVREEERGSAEDFAAAASAEMGAGSTPVTESEEELKKAKGASVSLPKHSYWFDFWVFVVFDIAFFLVMYFIVP
uniref:Uncharacterized protein n=1 Tax=Amphiprion ocellaris TaxID=80972 RepID=A0A3Q1AY19_AMPOC